MGFVQPRLLARSWRRWTLCDKLRREARLEVVWKLCPGKNLWFSCRWIGWSWERTGWSSRHQEILPIVLEESVREYTSNELSRNWKTSTCDLVGFRVTRILPDYICPKTFPGTGVECRHWCDVMWCGDRSGELLNQSINDCISWHRSREDDSQLVAFFFLALFLS
jgi:hypothetical protein